MIRFNCLLELIGIFLANVAFKQRSDKNFELLDIIWLHAEFLTERAGSSLNAMALSCKVGFVAQNLNIAAVFVIRLMILLKLSDMTCTLLSITYDHHLKLN